MPATGDWKQCDVTFLRWIVLIHQCRESRWGLPNKYLKLNSHRCMGILSLLGPLREGKVRGVVQDHLELEEVQDHIEVLRQVLVDLGLENIGPTLHSGNNLPMLPFPQLRM